MENALLIAACLWLAVVCLGFMLIAMSVFYVPLPLIRRILNRGNFDKKRAKRIALWNSALVGLAVVSCLIQANFSWWDYPKIYYFSAVINGFVYYWININILTREGKTTKYKKKTENILLPQEEKEENISETNAVSEP